MAVIYLAGYFINSANYIVLDEGVCILMKFLSGCAGWRRMQMVLGGGYQVEPNQSYQSWYENEVGLSICLGKEDANPNWVASLKQIK